jgi:hypothetical protein
MQHITTQYNTVKHSITVQHSIAQYNTIQHITTQYNTTLCQRVLLKYCHQVLLYYCQSFLEFVSLTHPPPLPPGMFLLLIFTRDWVDPRAIVPSEGNMSLKNPVAPPGSDPRTARLVAQRLSHYGTPGPILRSTETDMTNNVQGGA